MLSCLAAVKMKFQFFQQLCPGLLLNPISCSLPCSLCPRHTALRSSLFLEHGRQALFHLRVSHTTSFCLERHSSPVLHMAGSLSSYKSSLNVTSSERLSVTICICQGPGGKQWHTHMRVIQGVLLKKRKKNKMIVVWSKTKGAQKGTGPKQAWAGRTEEQANSCSQLRGILHKEVRRINILILILLSISCWSCPLAKPTRSQRTRATTNAVHPGHQGEEGWREERKQDAGTPSNLKQVPLLPSQLLEP